MLVAQVFYGPLSPPTAPQTVYYDFSEFNNILRYVGVQTYFEQASRNSYMTKSLLVHI